MSGPAPTLDHVPEWADPWGHADYFRAITRARVIAYLLDALAVALLVGGIYGAGLVLAALTLGLAWPLVVVMVGLAPLAYHSLLIGGPRQATLGMQVMSIKVMSLWPGANGRVSLIQALVQTLGFYLSIALTCWLILFVVHFNPRRRTLHDGLAGTVVVRDFGQ
jgi:uncharacterized RDD family membrane protein YckC